MLPTPHPHGDQRRYNDGCRCTPCRGANAAYQRDRRRQRAYGRVAYVDAAPVRAHLHHLSRQGLGWKRAAALAGVSTGVVTKLLFGDPSRGQGPSKRCRPRAAAALLAVRADLDHLADGAFIPATGTRRRLQGLVALGWPQRHLADRLGIEPTNLTRTIRAERVTARTARAVRDLDRQLAAVPPPQHTAAQRRSAAVARAVARRHGWVPPHAWDDDDLDNPAARPAELRRTAERGFVDLDEVELLESAGCSRAEIADRLGVHEQSIATARHRAQRSAA